jgi:hypothetical protein
MGGTIIIDKISVLEIIIQPPFDILKNSNIGKEKKIQIYLE